MPEHYDVIVIGSGAGGGAVAHTLAPTGARILLLERGDFLPREMANWDVEEVFEDNRYISEDTWYDADGQPFQPQVHYFVGGATKLYGAALYRLRPQDFGELQPRRRRLAGLAARPTTTSSRGTPRPSGSTRCTATTARTPPRATGEAVPVARGLARAADPADLRRPAARATTRSTRPAASCSTRPTGPGSTCIRCTWCDGYPCLVHAKADAEAIAVRPLLDRAERHPAGQRRGGAARDRRGRALGDRRRRARGRGGARSTRPTSSSCRPGRPTRPRSCCGRPASGTRTAWPTARARSAATTCSTTARP